MAGTASFNDIVAVLRRNFCPRRNAVIEEHLVEKQEALETFQKLHRELMSQIDAEIACKKEFGYTECSDLDRYEIFWAVTNLPPKNTHRTQEAGNTRSNASESKPAAIYGASIANSLEIDSAVGKQPEQAQQEAPAPSKPASRLITDPTEQGQQPTPYLSDRQSNLEPQRPTQTEPDMQSKEPGSAGWSMESAPGYADQPDVVHLRCTRLGCDWEFCGHEDTFPKCLKRHIEAKHKASRYACQKGCGRTYTTNNNRKKHEAMHCKGPISAVPRKGRRGLSSPSQSGLSGLSGLSSVSTPSSVGFSNY